MDGKIASEVPSTDEGGSAGLALLAHDVRSSMFGLMGSLELIQDNGLPSETLKALNRARASSVQLADLLQLVFGGTDQSELRSSLNVKAEIASFVQRWYDRALQSKMQIEVEILSSVDTIETIDRVSFHRIFDNLLGNAIKYSKQGVVTIKVLNVRDDIVFMVCDAGPGFCAESLDTLFEFGGRPEDSAESGSGLGLYISKSLVISAGGSISVGPNEGGGACVTVTLPMSTAIPVRQAKNEILPDLSHLNILLAEDNITNQMVVTQMLKSMGARFAVASDGVEALDVFERGNFDVVLLDIEMPRKSGLEVLREIRARSDRKSGTPLIALTAYVMQEHRAKIDAAGADGLISKPIAGISPLGRKILEYMHGSPAVFNDTTLDVLNETQGCVDRAVYDGMAQMIGPDFLSEFLDKVIMDFEAVNAGLTAANSTDDFSGMRSHSHVLISVAGAIGATRLQMLAEELNAAAHANSADETKPLNSACIAGISDVIEFLSSEKTG